jgi:hypothetical protein
MTPTTYREVGRACAFWRFMTKPHFLRRLAAAGVLGTAAIAVAAGAPAGAADAAKPTPCNGVFAVDPAGDAEYDANGTPPGGATPGQPNMDITSFFLNHKAGADGKPVLTANIVLKNLDMTQPEGQGFGTTGGLYYYAYWTYNDEVRFVKAYPDGDQLVYGFGTVDPDSGVYTTDGETKGAAFMGPDGIVQIDIPEEAGGKVGEKLGGLLATTETIEGQDDFFGINHHADWTPTADGDDASISSPNGKDYTVEACPPETGGTPTGGGTGGGTTAPAPAAPSGPTTLPLKSASTLGSAKKAKKKKSLRFKVTAGEAITNLRIALKDRAGKKPAFAQASIASLKKGTSYVKLKVTRKLKAGKYRLDATGFVNGQGSSVSQKVTVKK